MASMLSTKVLDNGLNYIHNNATHIYICSQDPGDWTSATQTFALGNYNFGTGNVFGAPATGSPNGRAITSNPIANGTVTASSPPPAACWAVVNSSASELLANGQLTGSVSVTAGNTFTLAPFTITIPNQ